MCPMSLVFVASRLFNKFNLVFECNFWSHAHYFVCITLFDSTYFCLRCFFLLRSSRCFSPALCCSWVNTGKRLKWKCKNLVRPKKFKETKIKGVGPIRSIHGNNNHHPKCWKKLGWRELAAGLEQGILNILHVAVHRWNQWTHSFSSLASCFLPPPPLLFCPCWPYFCSPPDFRFRAFSFHVCCFFFCPLVMSDELPSNISVARSSKDFFLATANNFSNESTTFYLLMKSTTFARLWLDCWQA